MVEFAGLDRMIEEHPFFKGMNPASAEIIAGCAKNERFDADQYIFRENEAADRFYLIRHGQVALEVRLPGRKPLIVDTLHEGDVLGWSWIVPPYRWHLDARAVQLTRVVSLDAKCLRGKMESNHTLGYELHQRFVLVMAQRLAAGRLQLVDMFGQPEGR